MESIIAERLIVIAWRLRRVPQVEAEILRRLGAAQASADPDSKPPARAQHSTLGKGGVNAALRKALERAIRGASAMGLEQVKINGAFRAPGFVVVQILATPTGGVTSRRDGGDGGSGGQGRPDGPAPLPPVFPGKPERF